MENVVLVIHLILALSLIGAVLMQRSEGGGLGIGGGGGTNARAPSTAMGKVTWVLAGCFIATSIALTIIAAEKSAGASVLDRVGDAPAAATQSDDPADLGEGLLPPAADSAPLVPSAN